MEAPNSIRSSLGLGEGCGSLQSIVQKFPGGFPRSCPQHPALIGQTGLSSQYCLWWAPAAQLQFNPHPHSAATPHTLISTFQPLPTPRSPPSTWELLLLRFQGQKLRGNGGEGSWFSKYPIQSIIPEQWPPETS